MIALALQRSVSFEIVGLMLLSSVLIAIQLYCKLRTSLREIEIVPAEGKLPVKCKAVTIQLAQFPPQQALSAGRIATELSGALYGFPRQSLSHGMEFAATAF